MAIKPKLKVKQVKSGIGRNEDSHAHRLLGGFVPSVAGDRHVDAGR